MTASQLSRPLATASIECLVSTSTNEMRALPVLTENRSIPETARLLDQDDASLRAPPLAVFILHQVLTLLYEKSMSAGRVASKISIYAPSGGKIFLNRKPLEKYQAIEFDLLTTAVGI